MKPNYTLALPVSAKAMLLVSLLVLHTPLVAQSTPPFDIWLAELREEVLGLGIKEATVELAFSEITPPVQRVIQQDRAQPERVETFEDYIGARVSEWRITNGRERMVQHQQTLEDVAAAYGVQPRFIVAIWGMETNFGTFRLAESLFNVLATLAYDNRRGAFFRSQFIAAVRMLDSGFPTYDLMKSSWAGALGQSQFIPESYLSYAVDHDGDGRRDIWTTEADVFASIANYLSVASWRSDLTWGRPVQLPAGSESQLFAAQDDGIEPPPGCSRYGSTGAWRNLQDWQALGVRRQDGTDLPTRSIPAALVMADPDDGQAYIVYQNFCSIMRYNPALKYAVSIGLLSDSISLD